jgi:hypothetical protein
MPSYAPIPNLYPHTTMFINYFKSPRIALLLFTLAAVGVASTAHGQGFFSNSYTVQGKTLDLGYAGRTYQWAIFGLNGDVSVSDTTVGNIDVVGNIGVAGTGNFTLSGAKVQGDVWLRSGGAYNVAAKDKGSITGTKYQGATYDAVLNHAVTDANTLSTNASSLTATNTSYTTINTTNTSFTIAGTGYVVLKLTDFMMSGGTLTLQGTAATVFIIDVNRYWSLSNAAKVITSGGLLASNVLFNVEGGSTSNAVLSGASELNAILLAKTRTVSLTGGAIVNGEIIAKSVLLSGASKVRHPPKVSAGP